MFKKVKLKIVSIFSKFLEYFFKKKFPDEYKYIYDRLTKAGFKFKEYKNSLMLFYNNDFSFWVDPSYPWIAFEIFSDDIYNLKSNFDLSKKYTVIDIGANRGYASIYFASKKWCKDVYAFELIDNNYRLAKQNISLNSKYIKENIHIFNFGLGKKSGYIYANFIPTRDGICCVKQKFLDKFAPEEKNNIVKLKSKIKKSSYVLKKIINENQKNIIIKIDVEGSEYDIFRDLSENFPNIFSKTNIIIGETHLGFKKFIDILDRFDYKIVYCNKLKNGNCTFELFNKGNL